MNINCFNDKLIVFYYSSQVRWVGYSSDFDSWLNRKNITGKDLIKDYKRRKNNNTIQKSLELSENPPEHKFAKDSLSKCHKSHEIEFIVDRDVSRGKICYLVKLKEHDDFYWEYEENIKDNTLINDYKVRKKNYKLQIKEFDAAIVERQKSNERRRRILEDQQAANEVIEISSDDFL